MAVEDDPYLVRIARVGASHVVSIGTGSPLRPVITTDLPLRHARRLGLIASAIQWRVDEHDVDRWEPTIVEAVDGEAPEPRIALATWVAEVSHDLEHALEDGEVAQHLHALALHAAVLEETFRLSGGTLSLKLLRERAGADTTRSLLFVLGRVGLWRVDASNERAEIPVTLGQLVIGWARQLHGTLA